MKQNDKIPKWGNCLIAMVDGADSGGAYQALKRTGLEVLRLSGHDDREPMGALHKMENESGGELKILDEMYEELSNDNLARIVEVAPDRLSEISELLYGSGARSVWELDDLTFTKKAERPEQSRVR